jgi:hypothetical protein
MVEFGFGNFAMIFLTLGNYSDGPRDKISPEVIEFSLLCPSSISIIDL